MSKLKSIFIALSFVFIGASGCLFGMDQTVPADGVQTPLLNLCASLESLPVSLRSSVETLAMSLRSSYQSLEEGNDESLLDWLCNFSEGMSNICDDLEKFQGAGSPHFAEAVALLEKIFKEIEKIVGDLSGKKFV